ncbi:MAG: DUF2508 family protein [Clostridia bacterium]|nr:DUF2508 family protein [Clostridia bacterium]
MLIDLFAGIHSPRKNDDSLVREINSVSDELRHTYSRFNEATDYYEIDSLIFHLNELESHYSYLVKLAKLEKICVSGRVGRKWE